MTPEARLELFRAWLTERGLKVTVQRKAIAEVFFAGGRHVTLADLLVSAKDDVPGIGFATVYRTMKLLAESGLASEHKFSDGQESRYEPKSEGEHHDHLICQRCGLIVEFEDEEIERLQTAIGARFGFEVRAHRHEIYGVCQEVAQGADRCDRAQTRSTR